jgi:hypothetical protein
MADTFFMVLAILAAKLYTTIRRRKVAMTGWKHLHLTWLRSLTISGYAMSMPEFLLK